MIEYLHRGNIEELLDISHQSHADSAWKDYPFDRAYLKENLSDMINNENSFTCMYRKGEELIGYFFASLAGFLFTRVLIGSENGIYIKPEHRGGPAAVRMQRAFTEWCRVKNVEPMVDIYFNTDADNEKTYSFMRKSGMIECGRSFRGGFHGLQKER